MLTTLANADLTGAHMKNVQAIDASFQGAILSSADMSNADLSDADLEGADLEGANLTGAQLTAADLYSADLSQLGQIDTPIGSQHPTYAGSSTLPKDLTPRTDLSFADLSAANLTGAVLYKAIMKSVHLQSYYTGRLLPGPTMYQVDLMYADMTGAVGSPTQLVQPTFFNTICPNATISSSTCSWLSVPLP
ncbi:MAG: pentapeptide repeat-containing protein [Solirubrobacterales bacterium]|nr:pentapeptide repeat-containing protein [Solirubrobacterales bacterium]